ncbi:MAG: Signal peptidase I [Calditrichaeota bacterium]|nr:Signal peptidase I [Calditrichota bacterium]
MTARNRRRREEPGPGAQIPEPGKQSDNPIVNAWRTYRSWRRRRKIRRRERRKRIGPVRDWLETIGSVIVIVFVIRVAAVEAYRIPTGSMENTLLVGDFLLVNKFVYGIRTPDWLGVPFTEIGFSVPYTRLPGISQIEQGDILVFRYPLDKRVNYIKRCVAVGGQTVEIRNKQLYVDGKLYPPPDKGRTFVVSGDTIYVPGEGKITDPYILPPDLRMRQIRPPGAGNKDNYGPVAVPEGHLFMMGDNRDNSADSRYWGFLDEDLVLGRAEIIYFSWNKLAPLSEPWELVRWGRMFGLIR